MAPRKRAPSLDLTEDVDPLLLSALSAPPQAATPSIEQVQTDTRWETIRGECAELGPGREGYLLWVEDKCVRAGMHRLDAQWMWHFREFYKSGKRCDIGRFGLRAAKSDSCCRTVVAEVLLNERHLEPGTPGVCPILAHRQIEAAGRFALIKTILAACGFEDVSKKRGQDPGPFQFACSGGGATAQTIQLLDSQGHPVEFRVSTASVAGTVGFTGISGFGDEVDLWGEEGGANPCEQVVDSLAARFTTQPGSSFHLMSASYPDRNVSYFDTMIAEGDTLLRRVARLGEAGSAKDYAARMALAAKYNLTDALLTAPPLALDCTDIPCWVSNPVADIESCYALQKGDVRKMLLLHGGREGKRKSKAGFGDLTGFEEAVRRANQEGNSRRTFTDLPAWDPYSSRYGRGDKRSL